MSGTERLIWLIASVIITGAFYLVMTWYLEKKANEKMGEEK